MRDNTPPLLSIVQDIGAKWEEFVDDILGDDSHFNYISSVLGFDAVAKWRTDELLAMTNLLVMFVQGKGQWEEFQRFWNAFGG